MTLSLSAIFTQPHHTATRGTLATYFAVWHQRRTLGHLDAARLADLGLTRDQAMAEAARHIWDLPCDPH